MPEAIENGPPGHDRPKRLLRMKEVQQRVGLGRSTIYRWMAQGRFPRPVRLGAYAVAWSEDDIVS